MNLATHMQLVLRLRMSGGCNSYPNWPPWRSTCLSTRTNLTLRFLALFWRFLTLTSINIVFPRHYREEQFLPFPWTKTQFLIRRAVSLAIAGSKQNGEIIFPVLSKFPLKFFTCCLSQLKINAYFMYLLLFYIVCYSRCWETSQQSWMSKWNKDIR
jgi:hypothetical protein